MNTIRSTWYGWGALCVAGGGAYYFAKQSINADRQSRHDQRLSEKQRLQALEATARPTKPASTKSKKPPELAVQNGDNPTKHLDHAGSPSSEASQDAAPVGHAPETEGQRIRERSKYEAAEPFRSKKGDRFS